MLTKEDVRQHGERMVSDGVDRRRLLRAYTGGTTGTALRFYSSPEAVAFQWAVWWRHRQRFGISPDDWHVNFTGKLVGLSGVNGFELCGGAQASCRFAPAQIKGDDVVLANAGIATRVRYCWGDAPVCTLYDSSGLPAGPFEMKIGAK